MEQRGPARLLALALTALVVALAGCGASVAATPASTAIVSATVLRTSVHPNYHIPPFTYSITSTAQARKLYSAMLALPTMSQEVDYACPVLIGVGYQVTFTEPDERHFTVTASPDGCPTVTFSSTDIRAAWYPSFWTLFDQTVHLTNAALLPKPAKSGPSAPPPPPSL